MAFVERVIDVTFTLGEGSFGTSGQNTITLSGIDSIQPGPRISARITGAGGAVMSNLEMNVFGMTLDQMNQMSTLGLVAAAWRRNSVVVLAGDANSKPSVVFGGTITEAWFDGNNAPEISFRVAAQAGYYNSLIPAPAVSFNGSVDIGTVLGEIAKNMVSDTNNPVSVQNPQGVTVQLSNPYFSGSPRPQAAAAIAAAGLEWNGLDDGTITYWKPGQYRDNGVIEISAETGMIGYPSFTSNGVMFRTLFNPNLKFGSRVSVKSILFGPGLSANPAAKNLSREWVVISLSHEFEANLPGGKWFSTVEAAPPGLVAVASNT